MKCNLQNKDLVLIIHISWKLEFGESLEKLQDLHKSGVIVYAKICTLEKSIDDPIPTTHMIMRFYKRKSILQIKSYFPSAELEKIASWKIIKEKMCGITINTKHAKIVEIGQDSGSKQAVRKRHYEQRKSTKNLEMVSASHNRRLYDIVELQQNPITRRTGLSSHLFNQRPDLIRERHQGIKLAREIAKDQRMERFIAMAESVKWRDWQKWLIEKATKQERAPREILVVFDPVGNTGKSYFRTMFSLLHPKETCKLQNGHSQNMFHSAGKVDDLKYVLMDLARSDKDSVNYSAIEQIKNGDFDTCKYNNENVCVEPPFFAIFTNFKLHWWSLSLDRWTLLYIDKEKDTFLYFPRYNRDMKKYFDSDSKFNKIK